MLDRILRYVCMYLAVVLLKHNVALACILLASIVCELIEQHAIVCVKLSVSVLYARRLSSVFHAQ